MHCYKKKTRWRVRLSWLAWLHHGPIDCGSGKCSTIQVLRMQSKRLHRPTTKLTWWLYDEQTKWSKYIAAFFVILSMVFWLWKSIFLRFPCYSHFEWVFLLFPAFFLVADEYFILYSKPWLQKNMHNYNEK